MKKYVDGYVLPVPKNKLKEYQKMADHAGQVWTKHGALEYIECAGEDLMPKPPEGMEDMEAKTFPELLETKPDETVIFAFVVYESREHRDKVNAKVMKEFMKEEGMHDKTMPFDMKRMAYGGFESIVQYDKEMMKKKVTVR